VDTTTAHDKLVFGMFALMAEYEAALIKERTQARPHRRPRPRPPRWTQTQDDRRPHRHSPRMYDSRQFTMTEIAQSCAVTPMTIYRHINTRPPNLAP